MKDDIEDDEIVITLNREEYAQLVKAAELLRRVCKYSEVLTLEWLDTRRAEFP